jgi:hypothetical protein
LFPAYPAPASDAEALTILHRARTESASVSKAARIYSHEWLVDRGFPSGLDLNRDDRTVAEAVGISVRARDPSRIDVANEVHDAMQNVVLDTYANGDHKRVLPSGEMLIKRRMADARAQVLRIAC